VAPCIELDTTDFGNIDLLAVRQRVRDSF
jgi:hypothetical protein